MANRRIDISARSTEAEERIISRLASLPIAELRADSHRAARNVLGWPQVLDLIERREATRRLRPGTFEYSLAEVGRKFGIILDEVQEDLVSRIKRLQSVKDLLPRLFRK